VAALPRDVTVLLIEHDMDLVLLRRPDFGAGQWRDTGRARWTRWRDPRVKAVYLGEAADA
jgi:branched-chain amino acid transport system ATP-binding protein